MKRLLFLCVLAGSMWSCTHNWVGRPVMQLQRELGRPRSIRPDGTNQIYVYPDTLAGRGEMTFTVDSKGIIRSWHASANVPGVFGGDVFGSATDDFGNPIGDFGNTSVNGTSNPNGGFGGQR